MIVPHASIWPDGARFDTRGHLTIGGCDTVALAQEHGTPLYLLDELTFCNNCRAYRDALARHYPGGVAHYASKALLNTAVAQLVAQEQLGLDVVSGGELYVALRAGLPASRIHLHGNAKPRAELEQALAAGIGKIVVDTLDELELLARLTQDRNPRNRHSPPQAIMLRLAPDIAVDTHAHIETGRATSKFGLPLEALDAAAAQLAAAPGLRLAGLHTHLGSQIFDYTPIIQAIGVLLDCAARLRDQYQLYVGEISPGGGLGVPYIAEQAAPDVDAYVSAIGQTVRVESAARGLPPPKLVLEPGRSIAARAGVALYEIVATKQLPAIDHQPPTTGHQSIARRDSEVELSVGSRRSPAMRYLHIDGGMADNIRPALYGARYTALLANRTAADAEVVHVAGRYCESGDVLLRDIRLPRAELGDLLAIASAGAYTLSMASNYNLVPRPPLLLVGDGHARVIQRRESYADLAARDLDLNRE
jgi:diaminopimelate decarboxylase